MTHRYAVRKIHMLPLAKFGCLLGGLAMLLPGMICAFTGVQIVSALRLLLDQWQSSQVDLLGLGAPVEFDFINLLGLETTQTLLARLDDQQMMVALLIILISILGGGLLVGLTILLVGWGYNLLAALTGGLEVELQSSRRDLEIGG